MRLLQRGYHPFKQLLTTIDIITLELMLTVEKKHHKEYKTPTPELKIKKLQYDLTRG